MSTDAFIFDAIRTPRAKGKPGGGLYSVKPVTLLGDLLTTLQQRNNFDTADVDDIVIGCVSPVGDQGACIAKTAALYAGWHENVAGVQLNRFCASGLEAVNMAAQKIASGWEDLVVAGGVESMSRVPMGADGGAWAMDPETNLKTYFVPQGIGADLIATIDGYSREDVDAFALNSQQKAAAAIAAGYFDNSRIAVKDQNGLIVCDTDELVRAGASMEDMAKLRPAFRDMGAYGFDDSALARYPHIESIQHVHTAANSSGIVDGACTVLIGNEAAGQRYGMAPRARIVSTALVGTDATIMLTGPAPAARKALAKAGLKIDDIDLFEVNEAFAAVVMRFMNELDVDPAKVNVNGGSIAMGHPLGATGAMITGTLVDELHRQNKRYGLATLCVGGGMGIATIVERV
jgi:acetyl-CoA C-acetyltransferase